jgi:hypothetical protein
MWKPSCELDRCSNVLFRSQVQFLILGLHSLSLIFMDETCECPKIFGLIWAAQQLLMFFMFAEFYRKAYKKKNS